MTHYLNGRVIKMKILGVHDGHNASTCLLENGKIIMVMEEERITRLKNFSGFPKKAIEHILSTNNIGLEDIDYVALNGMHMSIPADRERTKQQYRESSSLKGDSIKFVKKSPLYWLYKQKRKRERLLELQKIGIPEKKVTFIDHHLAHASAAYFGSPWWKKEDVLVLTNDGAGDNICASINIGKNGVLERISSIHEDESVAWYYGMVTFVMGMVPLEHEYKIMGLAPYAPEDGKQIVFKKFNNLMKFQGSDSLEWKRNPGVPPAAYSYDFVRDLTEVMRFDWIAAGLQAWVEHYAVEWVRRCIRKTGIHKLALSGGFFMNVKVNQEIAKISEVTDIFIFPSCGDESNSIGAAFALYAEKCKEIDKEINLDPLGPIYFGTDIKESDVETSISKIKNVVITRYENIDKQVGKLLAEGNIVARCKGKMEFGARALGNRSILADPSDSKVVKIINDMIKNRDFWMPFAPTILKERSHDYIINPKEINAPYMLMGFDSNKQNHQQFIAAIHPSDLTARPQILEKEWNLDYYTVIKEFEKITGRGVILNTSFNLHGYPIVWRPQDALYVFENSGLEYLALDNILIEKEKTKNAQ